MASAPMIKMLGHVNKIVKPFCDRLQYSTMKVLVVKSSRRPTYIKHCPMCVLARSKPYQNSLEIPSAWVPLTLCRFADLLHSS